MPNSTSMQGLRSRQGQSGLAVGVQFMLAARFAILRGAFYLGLIVSGLSIMAPRSYTAMASFTPQARRGASYASSIAAQFGISGLSGGEVTQTPQFYVDMLRSPTLLRDVVGRTYQYPGPSGKQVKGSLVELLGVSGGTPAQRIENASVALSRSMRIAASTRTGVVTFWVTAQSPSLAKLVADTVLSSLNSYNTEKRQSQAGLERRFTESRRDTSLAQLRASEGRLLAFVKANRNYASSPELAVEFDRLNREVQRLQQVYSGLGQAYEQARIDEVRDTPVISVIDDPIVPADADRRRLVTKGILAIVVGGLLGFGGWRTRRSLRSESDDSLPDVTQLLADVVDDLTHPLRTVRAVVWDAHRLRT